MRWVHDKIRTATKRDLSTKGVTGLTIKPAGSTFVIHQGFSAKPRLGRQWRIEFEGVFHPKEQLIRIA
jgi:hypothetical protein